MDSLKAELPGFFMCRIKFIFVRIHITHEK